jgi:hypothetical protein
MKAGITAAVESSHKEWLHAVTEICNFFSADDKNI